MRKNKLFPLFYAVLAAFCLISCKPKPSAPLTSSAQYNKFQLTVLLLNKFNVVASLEDEDYELVNEQAIGSLYGNYRKDLFEKGITKWDRKFDCNKFSSSFYSFAQISYFSSSGRAQSIAVGEVYYVSDKDGPHAINILVSPNGILFFEPQSGGILNLTESEKASIDFIKF